MRKYSLFGFCLLVIVVVSCVSMQDRALTIDEMNQVEFLGSVSVQFNSWQVPFHIIHSNRIKQRAYTELMKIARQEYQDNIEIRNIVITGKGAGWTVLNIFTTYAYSVLGNVQRITATGDVVKLNFQGQINQEQAGENIIEDDNENIWW